MKTAAWLLLISLLFSSCEKPLKLPYVTPELQNWPKSYKGVEGLKLHVFKTGEVTARKKLAYRGSSLLDTLVLDIVVFAIEHPQQGLILVGTGLSRGATQEAESYLGAFRTAIGSPTMADGQDIFSQLTSAHLSEKRVRTIILPDLRFSHTGELENFPTAQVVVSSAEYTAATEEEESALSISDEYDGVKQWRFIDFAGAEPLGTFRAHRDVFGDGSVLLIDVAGATAGGMAILVRLPQAPVLLCGNLAWTAEQAQYVREPGFTVNRTAWWENAWRLKKFAELAPELIVLPDNDWSAITTHQAKDLILHPFPPERKAEKKSETRPTRKLKQQKSEKKALAKETTRATVKEKGIKKTPAKEPKKKTKRETKRETKKSQKNKGTEKHSRKQ
jgi:glyoxylase-like metal-dependent hydrolase (beta-lactamase superfamily II)